MCFQAEKTSSNAVLKPICDKLLEIVSDQQLVAIATEPVCLDAILRNPHEYRQHLTAVFRLATVCQLGETAGEGTRLQQLCQRQMTMMRDRLPVGNLPPLIQAVLRV